MKPLRIGLIDLTSAGWSAGASFTRMLALSLKAAAATAGDVELAQLVRPQFTGDSVLPTLPTLPGRHLPGETTWRKLTARPRRSGFDETARAHRLDVLLPAIALPEPLRSAATIGWIPDFQDRRLPEFFPPADLKKRRDRASQVAAAATRILLSSEDSRSDFAALAPQHRSKVCVLPFPSLFAFAPPPAGAIDVCAEYCLPVKFALVANQFWTHKNHLLVVEAVRLLRARGIDLPVVMTGLPADYRDPANRTVSALLQAIASAGLRDLVIVLGQVPLAQLIELLRRAAVVIQPSRFEGWSTSVQDAKALGRPLLCSDLPVHREQAPQARGFFPLDDPAALATLLAELWPALTAGPDATGESAALQHEQSFAAAHGSRLLQLCREAAQGVPAR